MGPTWVLSAPDGLHVGPMTLAIRVHCRAPKLYIVQPLGSNIVICTNLLYLCSQFSGAVYYQDQTLSPEALLMMTNMQRVLRNCVIDTTIMCYEDVMTLTRFSHWWPFVQGIHLSPLIPFTKDQQCGPLMSSLLPNNLGNKQWSCLCCSQTDIFR